MSGPAASRPAADRNAQPVARHSQDGTWVASRLRRWRSARTWANPGPVKYRCSRVSLAVVLDVDRLARRRSLLKRRKGHGAAGDGSPCQPRRSEEHTSELQSLMRISYAVYCLKKKTTTNNSDNTS